jgi:ABC-type uncharacterized transport system substrate-binding protein
MLNCVKRLWLAVVLIAVSAGILLISDFNRRVGVATDTVREFPRIAVMQIVSTPVLDVHVQGVKDGLRRHGLLAADENNLRVFNPQGDFTTANAVAREMVQGDYDILITSSTVALQTVAKANLTMQVAHVFGAVTFPPGAGVGITGPGADEHPPYLTGIGTFQPVQGAFEIAYEMNPALRRVGVVWNPGEQCSEACMVEARKVCATLGIELKEVTATQSIEVGDALRSVISSGVDAIWIGGDTVANGSISMIIRMAQKNGVPVFTNDPHDAQLGALFGLGADYHTVGSYTADMAAQVLNGRSPASYRIENVIPEQLMVSDEMLAQQSSRWEMSAALKKRVSP